MGVKTFELEKTSIPGQLGMDLRDNFGYTWNENNTADFYRALFLAITDMIKAYQSTNTPRIGLAVKDTEGNFKIGAILNYQKPEEGSEEDSGNWYLEMTFDAEDLNDCDVQADNHSDAFARCFTVQINEVVGGRFRDYTMGFNVSITAIDEIVKFLDANAREGEEVELTLSGIFTATVVVEDGEKVMSIVPGSYVKQKIKNDSAL